MTLDAVERNGAGAGQVHLERAAELVRDLAHQLDLARACSDLCIVPGAGYFIAQLSWSIATAHWKAKEAVAKGVSLPCRIREVGNVVFLERAAT